MKRLITTFALAIFLCCPAPAQDDGSQDDSAPPIPVYTMDDLDWLVKAMDDLLAWQAWQYEQWVPFTDQIEGLPPGPWVDPFNP